MYVYLKQTAESISRIIWRNEFGLGFLSRDYVVRLRKYAAIAKFHNLWNISNF